MRFEQILKNLSYGVIIRQIWGNCSPSLLSCLDSIHARAAIFNLDPSLSDDDCLLKSNWRPISFFYKKTILHYYIKFTLIVCCQRCQKRNSVIIYLS